MTLPSDPSENSISVTLVNPSLSVRRFKVAVDDCDVNNKQDLERYRKKWLEWMSWYEHSDSEPNSIESQIHGMLFNDLTYRAAVRVRASVDTNIAISARSSTLAYLLDQGYVVSQILFLQRLLDTTKGVILLKRLLKDIEKYRSLITREIYVAGDGLPYNYDSWSSVVDTADPMVQMWGLRAPGLTRFAISKDLHETFDLLCGKQANERTRNDAIPKSIFTKLDGWISGRNAAEIKAIRDKFVAHSADAARRGSACFKGVRFSQIDDLQRAIVRVERALTDFILFRYA